MPKTFHEIARWDGGLNTHFDESDIEGTELSDISLWSVAKPGQIFTIGNYQALGYSNKFNDTQFALDTSQIGLCRFGFKIIESDYDIGASEVATVAETRYAVIITTAGKLTLLEGFGSDSGTVNQVAGGLGNTSDPKPRMFWSDGALRISDSGHGGSSLVKWFGVVTYQRFTNAGDAWLNPMKALAAAVTNKWVWRNASQIKPVCISAAVDTNSFLDNYGAVIFGSTALNYPSQVPATTMGKGINMNLNASTSETDGGWEATSYEFGQSLVYVGNQESMIESMRIWNTVSSGDASEILLPSQQYWSSIKVFASTNADYDYDDRITGARIYIRKAARPHRWTLFIDADFERGVRRNTFDDFDSAWSRDDPSLYSSNTPLDIKAPSPQTYESLNGYSPNESMCSFEATTHGWKDATVLNRRCFLIGVRYLNSYSGTTDTMPDRIFYSAVAKYDTFPTSNWIDIGVNDGESFTAIQGFANRLLAFKQGTLYIINVQNPNDGGWYLEAELKGMGISSADGVTKSDHGILFANKRGLFQFTGSGVPERLDTKLDRGVWASDLDNSSHFIQIGYDGLAEQCIVGQVSDTHEGASTSSTAHYVYDFRTQSFVRHVSYLTDGRSNFTNIPDTRELLWIEPKNDSVNFYVNSYSGNTIGQNWEIATNSAQYFQTKIYDFGSGAVLKRFYNLYIDFKTTSAGSTVYDFDLIINGELAITCTAAQQDSFGKLKVDISAIPDSSTFQLRLENQTTTVALTINKISLEYRLLYKRVS